MSGIGVITNPLSRSNRRDPGLAGRLGGLLGGHGSFDVPGDLATLASTAARLRERDVDTVCIHGGDGSIHKVVTALIQAWGEAPLPRIAVLPGGTMNIVAHSIGVRGRPWDVLTQVVASHHAGTLLPTTRRWVMRFEGDGLVPAPYGFLFGNGLISRFLEVYYEGTEPSPAKAARLLAHGAVSALVGGRFVRRLTRPWTGAVSIDGTAWGGESWTAVAAGSVEQIGLGFRPFPGVASQPGCLHAVGIGGSVVDLARDLPRIYRGRGPARPGNLERIGHTLRLDAPEPLTFMIDGDFYRTGRQLQITMDRPVDFIVPGP